MDWEYALIEFGAIAANSKSAAYVVLPSELNAQYTDPTLMASRLISGYISASNVTLAGAVAFGLIAWDDLNDVAPVGAELPGPITNGNLDWIIRQFLGPQVPSAVNGYYVSPGDSSVSSKARRRLGSSRGILAVIETYSVAIQSALMDCRVLVKE